MPDLTLGVWDAKAFRKCDMQKGSSFVDPVRNVLPHVMVVVSQARDDTVAFRFGIRCPNPYLHDSKAAAGLWNTVMMAELPDTDSPYPDVREGPQVLYPHLPPKDDYGGFHPYRGQLI